MSKAVAVAGFDYDGIDKDTKGKLVYLAGQVRKSTKGHIEYALEMGEHIHEANDALAKAGCEGRFSEWVKVECGFSRKTADNYMNAFARFGGNCESLTQFTAEAVYLLSSDDVPEAAVKEAIKLADKGQRIGLDDAKATVERHCPERAKRNKPAATAGRHPSPPPPDLPTEGTVNQAENGAQGKGATGKISGGTTFNIAELTSESKDAFGVDAPAELRQVFELCEEFDAQRAKLTGIKSWLTQRASHPGAVLLVDADQRIRTDLDQADTELKFAKPYCACVYCHNKAPAVANCNACKGRGWMTEPVYKAAPKEMKREKAKA